MRIFLYEFVSGGGFLQLPGRPIPDGSLLREGEAMWRAIYEDFTSVEDVEVYTCRDARLPPLELPPDYNVSLVSNHPREHFFNAAISCDFTHVIAPEFDQHLLRLVAGIEAFSVRTTSPNAAFIEITSDKTATCDRLTNAGVQVPPGRAILPGTQLSSQQVDELFPAVLKRNDGAGSMCTEIVTPPLQEYPDVMRIEQKVNGLACSISFLCQTNHPPIACPPMTQILSNDGNFAYIGGQRIMEANLIDRAQRIGLQALSALPPTNGYVGIDLVLGDHPHGDGDFLIEVNPRLTTSYLGLRHIAETNLADAMLQIAKGEQPLVSFSQRNVNFAADGVVR